MKKFLQNLALAGLTIVGVFVSSCTIEDIETTFDPSKAVAKITVSAFDALNGNVDISTDPELNITASSNANNVIRVSGNVITIEGAPAIQEQIVTIVAEYKGNSGQTTVSVKPLLSGGEASYPAFISVGIPQQLATAFVEVSVWDKSSQKDVTAESILTPAGVPEGYVCKAGEAKGTYVITGNGGISAFKFTIKAKYGDSESEASVNIDNIAKYDAKTYALSIAVGEAKKVPAVANIRVAVIDGLSQSDVTSASTITASLAAGSNASCKAENNVVTVTAGSSLKIDAQAVTITAKYNGKEKKTEFNLAEVAEGKVVEHNTSIIFETTEMKATATVLVSVWDKESEQDVTSESTLEYSGVPQSCEVKKGDVAGSYVITSSEDIAAFDFKVKATYKTSSVEKTVKIGDIKKLEAKTYTAYIEVGEAKEVPAVAHIHVAVIDGTLKKDVTTVSTITAKLLDAGEHPEETIAVNGNIVTITAGESLKISNVKVGITAKYGEYEDSVSVNIVEVSAGTVGEYTKAIIINDPAKYVPVKVSEKVIKVDVGTFTSSHGLHTYTHDYSYATTGHGHGSGQWLYNETEFILNTTVDYEKEYGTIGTSTEFARGCTAADMKMIVYYEEALFGKKAVKEPAQLKIKVSAFAMYSVFCTKTHTSTTYNIIRREEGKDDVIVGTVSIFTVSTQVEYCEAAIPGHDGHYHYLHGHDDVHGYSSNAGGGIIWAE